MRTHHVKVLTGAVVLLLAAITLGATAITTINAEREHQAHESRLRRLSEKAAKVLPKEAFKPGKYTLADAHGEPGYHISAVAQVDSAGRLQHIEFDQLDENGLFNPATAQVVTDWNTHLLADPNSGKLRKDNATTAFYQQYQKDMRQLLHAAHTGEEHHVTVSQNDQ